MVDFLEQPEGLEQDPALDNHSELELLKPKKNTRAWCALNIFRDRLPRLIARHLDPYTAGFDWPVELYMEKSLLYKLASLFKDEDTGFTIKTVDELVREEPAFRQWYLFDKDSEVLLTELKGIEPEVCSQYTEIQEAQKKKVDERGQSRTDTAGGLVRESRTLGTAGLQKKRLSRLRGRQSDSQINQTTKPMFELNRVY